MKNCGIASLFLDKEKFFPILSQNQNIFLMTGTVYKRMGKVEELIPINNDFVQILYNISDEKIISKKDIELIKLLFNKFISSFPDGYNCFGIIIKCLHDEKFRKINGKILKEFLSLNDISILFLNKVTLGKISCSSSSFEDLFYYDKLHLEESDFLIHNEKLTINLNFNIKRIIYMKENDITQIASFIQKIILNSFEESYILIKESRVKVLMPQKVTMKDNLLTKKESNDKKIYINISSNLFFTLIIEKTLDLEQKKTLLKKEIINKVMNNFDFDDIRLKSKNEDDSFHFDIKGKQNKNLILNSSNLILNLNLSDFYFNQIAKEVLPNVKINEDNGNFYLHI